MRHDQLELGLVVRHPVCLSLILQAVVVVLLAGDPAVAQQPAGSQLPIPRLTSLSPCGGKKGATIEVQVAGTDLDEPESLIFSHPGFKAERIITPEPPVDPKKPAVKPVLSKFKVMIPEDVPLGNHDVRILGKWGISNPRAFVVGDLDEIQEKEPNDDLAEAQRIDMNGTVNGVISASTDVDYFVFSAKKGQRIVVRCPTSSIDSQLHAGLELYDAAGKRVTLNRNYLENDALLDYTPAADGDYFVRLFEYSYQQGSADYFYRLTLSMAPWIDAVHPPVVEPGKQAEVTVYGRNLPGGQLDPAAVLDGRVLEKIVVTVAAPKDTEASTRLEYSGRISPSMSAFDGFEHRIKNDVGSSNPFLMTYARAPVVHEIDNNDTATSAQEVPIPCEIAGRIEKKKDRDWYYFSAKKGDVLSIELFSDRIGAPTDMGLLLRNAETKADLNDLDDNADTLAPIKFFTRSNDPPRLRFVAPADGKYLLQVYGQDSEVSAGPRHFYRLSIAPEKPDFRLVAIGPADRRPDSCRLYGGGNNSFTVLAWREGNFNDGITISAENLPEGVTCPPQLIGPGLKGVSLVLAATPDTTIKMFELKLKGSATIDGQLVTREVRPGSITWPVPAQQNIPTMSRLDRNLLVAVGGQAPFHLSAAIDKSEVVIGDKASMTLKLNRLWPDMKQPFTITTIDTSVSSNNQPSITINKSQQITIQPDKNEATGEVEVKSNALPGTYSLVVRGSTQIAYNKDPMAKEKPNIILVQPSTPVTLTVLPKQLASVTLSAPTMTTKVGAQSEVVVRVARMYDFAGEFKVELVMPPNVQGVSADELTIPAGKNEAKLVIHVDPDAPVGNRPDLIVRATALYNGKVTTTQETKLGLNVVK